MNKENKLVPKLRFPEFVNDGEWEVNSLSKHLLQQPEYGLNAPAAPYSEELPTYIRITDISEDGNFIDKNKVSVQCDVTEDNYLVDGDIVLARTGASVGKAYKYRAKDGRLVFAGFLIRLKPNSKNLDSELLFQYLNTQQYWKWVQLVSARSGQPGINSQEYASLPIPLPNTFEQQKIASCLSSLDELIAAHTEKLDALKDHKKGLMQQLFPAEGETVPKLRFKEFEKDGEWVETTLGRLIEIKGRIGYRGYTLNDIVNKGEGAISMSPSNIYEDGTLKFEKSTYISWTKYEESPEIMLQNGFTVLVKTGSTFGKVAYTKELNEKVTINPQLVVLKPISIDSFFLYLIVANSSVQRQINETVVGGAIPTLSQDSISKFSVLIPKPSEQQKIANFLSSIDDEIAAQTQKIEGLKEHKKGLMQGLFPSV